MHAIRTVCIRQEHFYSQRRMVQAGMRVMRVNAELEEKSLSVCHTGQAL